MVVGVYKAGIAQHVPPVDDLIGGDVQRRADGLDEAVLAVDIRVLQDAVAVVAGDQLGYVPDKQGGHGKFLLGRL